MAHPLVAIPLIGAMLLFAWWYIKPTLVFLIKVAIPLGVVIALCHEQIAPLWSPFNFFWQMYAEKIPHHAHIAHVCNVITAILILILPPIFGYRKVARRKYAEFVELMDES